MVEKEEKKTDNLSDLIKIGVIALFGYFFIKEVFPAVKGMFQPTYAYPTRYPYEITPKLDININVQ